MKRYYSKQVIIISQIVSSQSLTFTQVLYLHASLPVESLMRHHSLGRFHPCQQTIDQDRNEWPQQTLFLITMQNHNRHKMFFSEQFVDKSKSLPFRCPTLRQTPLDYAEKVCQGQTLATMHIYLITLSLRGVIKKLPKIILRSFLILGAVATDCSAISHYQFMYESQVVK